ncbi:MAG: MoaD/ThiS family protein [Candidatus Bathyarchaeota archaeon]|nr:MoaD/ThiS family protein [Candidatus Bathyarchaeota archaeon]MDH5753654.1 MoaD/ThiS family protein [Candidatus Bathyarchaeota archaeon]
MEITVKFFGVFRGISGKSKLTVKFENAAVSLKGAIEKIVEEMPRLKRVLIDPEMEDPRPNTLILVNAKEISVLNGLETMLKDRDEVVFISVLHAG